MDHINFYDAVDTEETENQIIKKRSYERIVIPITIGGLLLFGEFFM